MAVSLDPSNAQGAFDKGTLSLPTSLWFVGHSAILNSRASLNIIKGFRIARGSPTITHLFFADDGLILFKADKGNCDAIKESLKNYETASGQQINFDKSAISFSPKTLNANSIYIKDSLSLLICQGHALYLGLPTFSLRNKRIQFVYLRDRAAQKLDCWKNRLFSEGDVKFLLGRWSKSSPLTRCPTLESLLR